MQYSISLRYGQAWLRLGHDHEHLHIIRAPWCRPLFSERNGYEPVKKFMGWRYSYHLDPQPEMASL